MQTGQLKIGTMILSETNVVQDSIGSDARALTVTGRETTCDGPVDPLKSNIMGLIGKMIPVKFEYKTTYDGYYAVSNATVDYEKWYQGSTVIGWSLTLLRLGPDNAVDLESRVANVVRSNAFAQVGERWHVPAGGHTTYHVGAVTPPRIVRQSADGPLTVYRAIPASINPLWSCPVTGYASGRSRFIKDGIERLGERFAMDPLNWEMNNGLIRVKPYNVVGNASTIFLAFYDGTTWRERAWDIRTSGSSIAPLNHFRGVTVLRNDPECVIVRCVAVDPTNGNRVLIDLTMRRGSRFLECYVQRSTSGSISTAPDVNDPAGGWTDRTSYASANGPDQDGLVWAAGSSKTYTIFVTGGGLNWASGAIAADFWVGAEIPGPTGDTGVQSAGFEFGDTAGWGATNATLTAVTEQKKFGAYSGKLIANGAGPARAEFWANAMPATAGKSYTLTGWLHAPVSVSAQIAMHWNNSSTGYLSSTSSANVSLSPGVWTPLSVTGTAPTSTTNIGRQFSMELSPTAGTIVYGDELRIREATPSGDTAADMQQQYIAAMTEKVGVVRR